MKFVTLNAYLKREVSEPSLANLVDRIASACWQISATVRNAALAGNQGETVNVNPQGEVQKPIDLIADDIFRHSCLQNSDVGALISEEVQEVYHRTDAKEGDFVVAYDPLDGSSNIDVNLSVGSIFSISRFQDIQALLPAGRKIECAGYAIYGPSVMLVLTFSDKVDGFTLDVDAAEFVLTHPNMQISNDTIEFAINTSRERFWDDIVSAYVEDCIAGDDGPRRKSFNMRWTASMVADVHRLLCRGGVFLYPQDKENAGQGGKLRLLYEAQPMAFIVETAGGRASTGKARILDVPPQTPHQRTSVILGASDEIERLENAYAAGPVKA